MLASTLLGTEPPALPVARLVAVAGLFGVSEGSARVALSRMAAAGEVEADGGRYRLAGHLLERQRRQAVSRSPRMRAWRDRWAVVVLAGEGRPADDRAVLRRVLSQARLAEVRIGTWVRPDNLAVPTPEGAIRFTGRLEGDRAALAARLWPLAEWARRARSLLDDLERQAPALAAGDTTALAPGFVTSAAVLRHLQADPLLPDELLPAGWPGPRLRADYDAWDATYRALLRTWR